MQNLKWLFLLIVFIQVSPVVGQQLTLTPSEYNGYNISCFGRNNGSIDLTITGGTPPYSIGWSNGETTEDINNLAAGYYKVRVDDSDPLTEPVEAEITLNEPNVLDFLTDILNISEYGVCDGGISLTPIGGVAPYTFSWQDGSTDQIRSSLCAGNYSINMIDQNGCLHQQYYYLFEPSRDPNEWKMTGNYGINPIYNYIGTNDNTDLVFKTNWTERLRLKGNGEIHFGGNVKFNGTIGIGGNKIIGYRAASSGIPEIISFGGLPNTGLYSINPCITPNPNSTYQFNGLLQSFGIAQGTNFYNMMQMGFDGVNCVIDAFGNSPNPYANRLLLNYKCGRDVVVGNATSGNLITSQDFYSNGKVGIGIGSPPLTRQLEVIGDVLLMTSTADENNGFEFKANNLKPIRRGISLGEDPDGSFNFWINEWQNNSQTPFNESSFYFKESNNNKTLLAIKSDGKIGIATDDPSCKLDISTSQDNELVINLTNSNFQGSNNDKNVFQLFGDGKISIGGDYVPSGYLAAVHGKLITEETVVKAQPWPDYVFDSEYELFNLNELEKFILSNKHLPEVPSANEIEVDGIHVSELITIQMKKIEELTLYIISQQKEIDQLKNIVNNNK